jgi:hypothetical protein
MGAFLVMMTWVAGAQGFQLPTRAPNATFKSSVDLVRVAAIVRDHKGRFVRDLSAADFEVMDGGQRRAITEFRRDVTGVSVALLFDVSGSMEGHLVNAREAAEHVLSWLDARDEAAIFTFDTRLEELTPFTVGLKALPRAMGALVPFGATSLHDAIAQTARRVADREGRRRAVVVLTDGNDNASSLTPAVERSALAGPLADLAAWTGGWVFVASTPGQRSIAARQIIDELRHQYLIAFEASGQPGWHPLVVRARQKDLVTRARSGYVAGQAHPSF